MILGSQRERRKEGRRPIIKGCLTELVTAVQDEVLSCQGSHAEMKLRVVVQGLGLGIHPAHSGGG